MAIPSVFYGGRSRTGGTDGDLDFFDGASLDDLDAGFVQEFGTLYPYTLDDDSGAVADGLRVIEPIVNAGDKRWLLQSIYCENLTLSGGSILADANASGIITMGSVGGENLTWDFALTTDAVRLAGVDTIIFTDVDIRMLDQQRINFGAANDAIFKWETIGNDNLQLGVGVGTADQSGYFSIMRLSDVNNANRSPLATSADPVLRIYSSDGTQALDYLEFYFNQTDAVIDWGNGGLDLAGGNVGIGTPSPIELLDIHLPSGEGTRIIFTSTAYPSDAPRITTTVSGRDLNFAAGPGGSIRFNDITEIVSDFRVKSGSGWLFFNHDGTNGIIGTRLGGAADDIIFAPDTTEQMRLTNSGSLGIGNTPLEKLQVDDAIAISNDTEGSTGRMTMRTTHETHTLTLGASSVTTTITIPSGALLYAVSFNVDTAVADDGGDDTWSAAFSGGSTTTLATDEAAAQNIKVDTMIVPELASGTTEITFTPNGGNFTAGVIEIIAYYIDLTSLANV